MRDYELYTNIYIRGTENNQTSIYEIEVADQQRIKDVNQHSFM